MVSGNQSIRVVICLFVFRQVSGELSCMKPILKPHICAVRNVSSYLSRLENEELAEGQEVATYTFKTKEDKKEWTAVFSSTLDLDGTVFYARNAIDGDTTTKFESIRKNYYQWLQLNLRDTFWVKGLAITMGRSGVLDFQTMAKTEVRIGHNNILGTSEDTHICKNKLCDILQLYDKNPLEFDYVTPLLRQFITLQKFDSYGTSDSRYLRLNEIDVSVFCGAFRKNGQPCLPDNANICQLRANNYEFDYIVPNNEMDEYPLRLSASSNRNESQYHLEAMIDNDPRYTGYATKGPLYGDLHPWIQVDLTRSLFVYSVYIESPRGIQESIALTEVRVGYDDVRDITKYGNRICLNSLCSTTGAGKVLTGYRIECQSPLPSQYITVQRYSYKQTVQGDIIEEFSYLYLSNIWIYALKLNSTN